MLMKKPIRKKMNNVIIENNTEDILSSEDEATIINAINSVVENFNIKEDIEVSVTLVSSEEIKKLNNEYRDVDKVTDVLSFPIDNPLDSDFSLPTYFLGDVVINREKIMEQSIEFSHSYERELSYLVVHSMLHLLGYDHIEEEDRVLMRHKEKEIMSELGIFK